MGRDFLHQAILIRHDFDGGAISGYHYLLAPTDPSQIPGRRLQLWFRWSARVLASALVALALTGAIYQMIGEHRDARRFPQRGRSVQTGGIKLNIDCTGQGSPTVVLDSGMGVPAMGWMKVQPEVAKFTRVCSYDRAGYGWSDPGPEPRTSLQIVKDLKALLDAAGERPPYILVGHSFGGYNVRVFASQYRDLVAGVVLVDASHEDEEDRINAVLPVAVRQEEKENDEWEATLERILGPIFIHLGIQRFSVAMGWADLPKSLSKIQLAELMYLQEQGKFRDAVMAEDKASAVSIAQVKTAGKMGDVPLIVLTAGKPYEPDPLLTPMDLEKQRNIWVNELQVELTHLSTRGKQIVVADSSHMIPFERPDAVVAAIREIWGGRTPTAP